ncbi:MAG: DUF2249 domain-containing protein [Candidatus Dactylopiibacterium sp.]|nr:DUF2249 domain-containing protein [Candidatus Dactylopiibacterium sp.]
MSPTSPAVTLDVRAIAPRFRHPLIFSIFDNLPPGQALLLTNDHDPRPLFYQFQAESAGQFSWDYLAEGPEVWQVRIGRPDAPGSADAASACCGNH